MFQMPANCGELEHPVVPVRSECAGLNQVTQFYYTVDDTGKRCEVRPGAKPPAGTMRRRMHMRLPLLFSPEMWIRHKYSLSDVIETLNYFRSIHLWQLAVLLGIPLSNSSVKLAFSTPTALVFSSKAIVLVKIANQLRKFYTFSKVAVLDSTHEQHVPNVAVHRVPMETYQRMKKQAPADQNQISMIGSNTVEQVFDWEDIQIVPMWMESDSVYCVRVVPEDVFIKSGRECDSLVTKPVEFVCKGKKYCGVVDESCFLLPQY